MGGWGVRRKKAGKRVGKMEVEVRATVRVRASVRVRAGVRITSRKEEVGGRCLGKLTGKLREISRADGGKGALEK